MSRRLSPLLIPVILSTACADPADPVDSASATGTGTDTSSGTDAESTSGATPTTSDSGAGATDPTTTEGSSGTGDDDTTNGGTSPGDDTTDGGTTGDEPSPWDGEPLPLEPPGIWSWVPFPDAICRDGSTTGLGVRYGKSDKLVIFFEGGGACFNSDTCILNEHWKNWDKVKFDAWALGIGRSGIFADDPQNPVRDWNFIYVPYCTGDVHAGDRENVGIDGIIGAQQFVGYRNVAAYLERIVPTFADTTHVLVTGISAGGFGAAFNYDRIAAAFPGRPVTLLDDSGPPLSDQYMPVCLQQRWRDLFGLDHTLPADCTDCFGPDGGGISSLALYLRDKWPDQRLALFTSEQDTVIRTFFGYGLNNCKGGIYPADAYEQGIYQLRDEILGDDPVWGTYIVPGTNHTVISGPGYYSTEVAGVPLTDWLDELLAGHAAHISP
ncbi:MAG TPA: pectin acetylesterase-family hydrolase [Nannocystis sp.]